MGFFHGSLLDADPFNLVRRLTAASYVISVCQASALPSASFRFHLTMNTLAVRLTFPPVGHVRDFHPKACAHAGRTTKNIPPALPGVCDFRKFV
jgi:hypothetical protein